MRIEYTINFLEYWHIGSGMGAGAVADAVVLKDERGLPYVPGKTIKGLVREFACNSEDEKFVDGCLGKGGEILEIRPTYFSNAELVEGEKIADQGLQSFLFEKMAFTALDERGLALDGSLRSIEFVIPMKLRGFVECEDRYVGSMKKYLASIKRMGLSRNRGFGRCHVKVES